LDLGDVQLAFDEEARLPESGDADRGDGDNGNAGGADQ